VARAASQIVQSGHNNPISSVVGEVCALFGEQRQVGCILSLGTGFAWLGLPGYRSNSRTPGLHGNDQVERSAALEFSRLSTYFRFSVDHGLELTSPSDWKDFPAIQTHTEAYLKNSSLIQRLNGAVGALLQTCTKQKSGMLITSFSQNWVLT
jgi:hypothetical protein